jgi:putative peptidoglycan lipid II flippase
MGQALLIIGGIALGLTVIVWGFSDWLVAQLFERGAFTAIDTVHVAEVQKYYSLQLTFQLAGVLLVRMLSALGKNRVILAVAMFNFLANILLNWIFMQFLGIAGIALATSVVLFISSLFCGAFVWRSLNAEFPGKCSV